MRAELDELRGFASQWKEASAKHAAEREAWETERAAMRAGISDEEGIEVARLLHNKLPKTDRPAFGDWLSQLRTKPDAAPKALRPYLGAEAAPAAPPLPRSNAGTVAQPTGPGAGPTITAEQLREARMHYQRTGDSSRMEALQAALSGKPGRA